MTSPFDDLDPRESELTAAWVETSEGRALDAVDRRIFWLVTRRLEPVAQINSGWDQLYRDPRDGRYWELTFPEGSLHGGGPRRLAVIDAHRAATRYSIEVEREG